MGRWMRVLCCMLVIGLVSLPTALADLRRGDRGTEVEDLQRMLYEAGWLFELPDGVFGRNTEKAVKDYEFSSWGEYIDNNSTLIPLCDTRAVLNRIPYNELDVLVNEPMSNDVACLDIENASTGRPSDDQVMLLIKEKTGATNSSTFQQLPDDIKRSVLIELKSRRASLRQLERLTGIGKSLIYRLK